MIAKTTTGSDFEGALTYGAGQRQGRKQAQAELLTTANVREGTPQRMAQEMQTVAATSGRIQKPVWHTSLSWPPGEQVSREQKIAAAEQYCELMGAPFDKHQVVVYEHHDKPHEHIHIYINRVPVDGGPALRTSNNFYRQPKVCKDISEALGMRPVPEQRRSVSDVDPTQQAAREQIRQAIQDVLRQNKGQGLDWFTEQLKSREVGVKYTHDAQGILRGVSFERNGVAATGQQVGYKGAQLRDLFTEARSQAQAQVSKPTTSEDKKQQPQQKRRGPRL